MCKLPVGSCKPANAARTSAPESSTRHTGQSLTDARRAAAAQPSLRRHCGWQRCSTSTAQPFCLRHRPGAWYGVWGWGHFRKAYVLEDTKKRRVQQIHRTQHCWVLKKGYTNKQAGCFRQTKTNGLGTRAHPKSQRGLATTLNSLLNQINLA